MLVRSLLESDDAAVTTGANSNTISGSSDSIEMVRNAGVRCAEEEVMFLQVCVLSLPTK